MLILLYISYQKREFYTHPINYWKFVFHHKMFFIHFEVVYWNENKKKNELF